ncbi:hypothetical protein SAMN05421738_102185 [Algoriella xinjiangensis]|uniref:Uncharacterized protein n=1 Tax=Algoriella xinjiangensis TaxID=684065 RepID=A0A1I4TFH3_9FLAO|nr:hypothetical protein [Algoriella xinjiangensis]SFM75476.1 hypothetical protein SAMN05421738_102185 [Algoriella xinjiangensis]VDH14979.1 Uncharacterised protein [Algoriella xinjiangensis]
MKNLKLYLTIFIFSLFTFCSNTFAQDCMPGDPECDPNTPPDPTNSPGNRKLPIDDYAPLLIITAITIAGLISYKQRELLKK